MKDDRFNELLEQAARDYNAPPETPRELIWARIEAVRQERRERRERLRFVQGPWVRWGIGIAAALVIGIGLGRLSLRDRGDSPPVLSAPGAPMPEGGEEAMRGGQLAYRFVTTEHLSRAEAFLTSFRSAEETADPEFWSGAGELLTSTRLLLDSPAAEDPVFRSLLDDLELVLVQIVRLGYERGEQEVELVKDGLEQRALLPRLRTAIPAGPVLGVEGVL